jgi:hypothetical protein
MYIVNVDLKVTHMENRLKIEYLHLGVPSADGILRYRPIVQQRMYGSEQSSLPKSLKRLRTFANVVGNLIHKRHKTNAP